MKRLRLTDIQAFQISQAYKATAGVLNEIKQEKLEGDALRDMKFLEEAVQILELLDMTHARRV